MHRKNKTHVILSVRCLVLTIGFLTAAAPAYAGFQWIAPTPPAAPAPPVWTPPQDQNPYAQTPIQPYPDVVTYDPYDGYPQALPPVTQPETVMPSGAATDIVQGFGDNVPLSIALRQVLPQDVGFSVAQDVSLGTPVSWRGGAPWRQIMGDMLTPAGLSFREQGPIVQVIRAGELPAVTQPLLPPPLPAPMARTPEMAPSFAPPANAPMAIVPSAENYARPLPPPPAAAPSMATGYFPAAPAGMKPAPMAAPMPMPAIGGPAVPTNFVQTGTIDSWSAKRGDTLQNVLKNWAKRAGVEMNWKAEYDFPLEVGVSFTASFEEAVRNLLIGFQDAKPQPVAHMYNNPVVGQTVLVVEVRGNDYNK
ncbi:MAG: toxin co-regulated pilus biosynthesis Q family protein [Alphaproteobacteria bacterium]|nr:toxin co-regulated pilus biosynthesis Q family protein [Alphaproteobacteria bacterium]